MTILLIDDSATVREVLRVALESEGYRVIEAPNGREGVRLYREHRPAIVIADIVMREKDGVETVRATASLRMHRDCSWVAVSPALRASPARLHTVSNCTGSPP